MRAYIYPLSVALAVSIAVFMFWPKICMSDAIDAIVGEASNQDYDTMICVAQAIRHRGTLKGVNGYHARHNKVESTDTWEMAAQAWDESMYLPDRVKGTKNFGTMDDLVKLRQLGYKVKCGDFYFY